MIPTPTQCFSLWDTYHLSDDKRTHIRAVWEVVLVMEEAAGKQHIDVDCALLDGATLLHDIDKNVPKLEGEEHPDACIRIMKHHGYDELIPLIRSHPLHAILDPVLAPKTIEETMLYVADKMTKYRPIGLEERFALWKKEQMTQIQQEMLNRSYEPAKRLASGLWYTIAVSESEVMSVSSRRLEEHWKLLSCGIL